MFRFAIGVACLVTLFAVRLTLADEVLLVGGIRFDARLVAIDDGFTFELPDGANRQVSFAELVKYGEPVPWQRPAAAVLVDGSELVALPLWTGRPPLAFDKKQISYRGDSIRQCTVAREKVVSCPITPAGRALSKRVAEKKDILLTTDGDVLKGVAESFDGTSISFVIAESATTIPLARVAGMRFSHSQLSEKVSPVADLYLRDGSKLRAKSMTIEGGSTIVELACGASVRLAGPDRIAGATCYSPNVIYLSELPVADYEHTPYFDLTWPYAINKNLAGDPLRAADKRFAVGIAVHSAARIVYRVPDGAERFRSHVAIDQAVGEAGSVIFRAYRVTDGKLAAQFESDVVRGGDSPVRVDVDISGSPLLVLVVDYADRGDERDHALWLDARFEGRGLRDE